ncbi:hypothetical protein BHE74_00051409, partial [Ensete ventricosum]
TLTLDLVGYLVILDSATPAFTSAAPKIPVSPLSSYRPSVPVWGFCFASG